MTAIANGAAGTSWRWPIVRARLRLWADALRTRAQWQPRPHVFSPTSSAPATAALEGTSLRHEMAALAEFFGAFEWQFWLVLALSAAVMLVLQANVTFWYGGSDHADYLNYGYYLLGQLPPHALPQWRTPGMGIFHIFSGTVLLDTWWGLRALHALMGVAIPVLTYLMIRPFSRGFALAAALVVILSMTPYVYAFQPLSDHLFYFLHALVLLLCVSYFVRRQDVGYALPIAIALSAAYLNLVRPVGAIIFWIFILVALITRPKDWRRLIIASGLYIAIMAVWIVWDRDHGANLGAMPGNFFPPPAAFTTTAERRLAEAYFSPAGLTHAMSEETAKGYPSSGRLRQLLRHYLHDNPEKWQSPAYFTPKELFGDYAGEPEKLLDLLFADHNSLYFGFIVRTAQEALGAVAGTALLYDVAAEHGRTGGSGWTSVLVSDPTRVFLGVLPKLSARMMMVTLYESSADLTAIVTGFPERMLTPDLGPATTRLLEIVRIFMYAYPQYCRERTSFQNCPEDYYQAIINGGWVGGKLNGELMGQVEGEMWSLLTWYLGFEPSQRLYAAVVGEILQRYPRMALLYYDNLVRKTVVRSYGGIGYPSVEELVHRSDAWPILGQHRPAHLTPGLANELAPFTSHRWPWTMALTLHAIGFLATPLFVLAFLLALPVFRGPTIVVVCGFLLLVYLQELASTSLLSAQPVPRYEGAFYLLPFLIACMLFGHTWSRWRNRRNRCCVNAQG